MWSVWRDSFAIHLGQGFALLRHRSRLEQLVEYPVSLPLADVLERVKTALIEQVKERGRARLHLTLGGAWCSPIEVSVPHGLKNQDEYLALVRDASAKASGLEIDDLECSIDIHRPGIAAAIPRHAFTALREWASAGNLRLSAVRPLWAVATQCAAARPAAVRCIAVHEPDLLSLVVEAQSTGYMVRTQVAGDIATQEQALRRWTATAGMKRSSLVRFNFSREIRAKSAYGPEVWADHWQVM